MNIVFPTQNDDRQAGAATALVFLAIGAYFSVAMIGIVRNATWGRGAATVAAILAALTGVGLLIAVPILWGLWHSPKRKTAWSSGPTSPRLRHRVAVGSQLRDAGGRSYQVRGARVVKGQPSYYAYGSDGAYYWLWGGAISTAAGGLTVQGEPQRAGAPDANGTPSDCPTTDWVTGPADRILVGDDSTNSMSSGTDSSPGSGWSDSASSSWDSGSSFDSGGSVDSGGSFDSGGSSSD